MSKFPRKVPVLVRTYHIGADGNRVMIREELLKDDPKNGVYDLSRWYKKYASFNGHYVSSRKDLAYRAEQRRDSRSMSQNERLPFVFPTNREQQEFEAFFDSQRGYYLGLIANKIISGELRDDLKLDALEALHDGLGLAYCKFDPNHPPKFRLKKGEAKPASLQTYCYCAAKNILATYVKMMNADCRGYNVEHLSISSSGEDNARTGEISDTVLEDNRGRIDDIVFQLDVKTLRQAVPDKLKAAFDLIMEEVPHYLIYRKLNLSSKTYRQHYLAEIQNLAADLGFEPHDERAFLDKMYVFRRKLRRQREARESAQKAQNCK